MNFRQQILEKLGGTGHAKVRAEELLQQVGDAFETQGSNGVTELLSSRMKSLESDFIAKLKLLETKL